MNAPQFASTADLQAHYRAVHARLGAKREVAPVRVKRWSYAPAPLPLKPIVVVTPVSKPLSDPAWKMIVNEVTEKHGLTLDDLAGTNRTQQYCAARHEAFFRLSRELSMSLPAIGRRLGNRHYTTVLNGIRKHEAALERGDVPVKRPREVINVMTLVPDAEVRRVVQTVAARRGLTLPQIIGRQRAVGIVSARDEAMYLCSTLTGLSQADIGRVFGDRVHSAVSIAVARHQARMETAR